MSHSHEHVASTTGTSVDGFTREATYAATRRPPGDEVEAVPTISRSAGGRSGAPSR